MKLPKKITKNLNPDELYKVLGFVYLDLKEIHETIEKLQKKIEELEGKTNKEHKQIETLNWEEKYESIFED